MTTERTDYATLADELTEGTLNPAGFSHRAHVGTAWELLARHDVFDALAIYARGLRALTAAAGVPEKFNATVTFAFISLIASRMTGASHDSADAFLAANGDLLRKGVLDPYYPPGLLASDLARQVPLLVDGQTRARARVGQIEAGG